jgi:homospermidine synthase
MVGFGSIGQATLPLLLRHFAITPAQITILTAHDNGDRTAIAARYGVTLVTQSLNEENYRAAITPRLGPGDFLLNLSVDISSLALIALCRAQGALYLDTCIEPWPGGYTDPARTPAQRTNYALREEVLAYRHSHGAGPTAVVTQGANPGLASTFVKQALLNLAADSGICINEPPGHDDWAGLAQRLGIRTIHIAERDTQSGPRRKQRGEFINTWSVAGFISEGLQPVELGWGSHERHWPADAARHDTGCDAAIYLQRPGAATRVRSWTPLEGAYQGLLISHGESISIADHLTLREHGTVSYRPTVHYAYHPCDDALLSLHELAGRNWQPQTTRRILRDEVESGVDELGVLLMGHAKGVYWYGSRLAIETARQLAPHNNATSLQVVAGIVAGISWALRHPGLGIIEPEEIDHRLVLEVASPYLGELIGIYGNWSPLQGRGELFSEELDWEDPWQFRNMRVT